MEKILFYSNSWDDFKEFVQVFAVLEMNGIEVAVSTHNKDLVPALAVGKLLVVTPHTYFDDATIVMDGKAKLPDKNCHYWSKFKEVFL